LSGQRNSQSNEVVNVLSVDIEDYFQVEGFKGLIPYSEWDRYEVRFQRGLEWLLQILDGSQVKATFFVLGWIAERYPHWIKEIARKGHEIGVHGYAHRWIESLTREEFKADVLKTLHLLKDLGIEDILGHRAPSFSITPKTAWAWDIVRECGLVYDASLSARYFRAGGYPWAYPNPGPQKCNTSNGRTMQLFPQAYLPLFDHIPFAGGGFFRLYPYWLTYWGIKTWNRRGVPIMVYVHPWEFDPEQPRFSVKPSRRFKHYVNLEINREKFARLLEDFKFCPCREHL
jgi:polysaccharide deacetylase family protein (PEP-CTERM system associated)